MTRRLTTTATRLRDRWIALSRHTFSTPIEIPARDRPATRDKYALPLLVAVALVVVLYAMGWWDGLVNAIVVLQGKWDVEPRTIESVLRGMKGPLVRSALAVVVIWGLCRLVGQSTARVGLCPRDPFSGSRLFQAVVVAGSCLMVTPIGFAVGTALGGDQAPPSRVLSDVPTAVLHTIESGLSGASEELALLAVPVLALRAARVPWWTVYVVATLIRISFHIYYGIPFALGMSVWAVSLVVLYQLTGRIWPMFMAHAAWDAQQALGDAAGQFPDVQGFSVVRDVLLLGIYFVALLAAFAVFTTLVTHRSAPGQDE